MALTTIAAPRSIYSPAYNPIVYVVNSTLKSLPGFRYVIELFQISGNSVKIAEFKVAPRTGDGYGYIDVSGILKNYVDKAIQFGSQDYDATSNTAFRYEIAFSEERLFSAQYSGAFNYNGNMAFYFAFGAHGVPTSAVGDSFRTTNTTPVYPDSRQNLNGIWQIKSIPDAFTIETTVPWGVVTGNPISTFCPGTFIFADRRVVRSTPSITYKAFVLNAALNTDQYKIYIDSASSPWQDNSAEGELLTNLPYTGFTCTPEQHLYMHCMDLPTSNAEYIYFQNSNGDVFRRQYPSTLPFVKGFAVGPGNSGALSVVSGSGPLIKSDTEWYEFWVRNGSNTWTSRVWRINIDRRCQIEPIQILFMDRKSSWASYAFQLRKKEEVTTEKTLWRKEIPKTITPGWVTMDRSDAGLSVLHSKIRKTWELNTNWMNDEMSVYFEELLSSPYCYINFGDGKWYSCLVEDGTYETIRYKNERLIRKTIRCYAALETPVQDAGTITPYIGQGYNLGNGYTDAGAGGIIVPIGDVTPPIG